MVYVGEVSVGPAVRFAGKRTMRVTFIPLGPDRMRQFAESLELGRHVEHQLRFDLHAPREDAMTVTADSPRHHLDVVVFASPLVRVGRWRCPADHPHLHRLGPDAGRAVRVSARGRVDHA